MSQGTASAAERALVNHKGRIDGVIALIETERAEATKQKQELSGRREVMLAHASSAQDALFLLDTMIGTGRYQGLSQQEHDDVVRQLRAAQQEEQILQQNIARYEQREIELTDVIERLREIKKRIEAA